MTLELVERYLKGDMSSEEKSSFEQSRKENQELDQLVVEHSLFLQQMDSYGEM